MAGNGALAQKHAGRGFESAGGRPGLFPRGNWSVEGIGAMTILAEISEDLKNHAQLCREILNVVEAENRSLNDPDAPSQFEPYQKRKHLLIRLSESLQAVKRSRERWQKLT